MMFSSILKRILKSNFILWIRIRIPIKEPDLDPAILLNTDPYGHGSGSANPVYITYFLLNRTIDLQAAESGWFLNTDPDLDSTTQLNTDTYGSRSATLFTALIAFAVDQNC
jgi:hypothetical protein